MKKLAITTFVATLALGFTQVDQAEASSGHQYKGTPIQWSSDCFAIDQNGYGEWQQPGNGQVEEVPEAPVEEPIVEEEEEAAETEEVADSGDVSAEEQQMVDLVNSERAQNGLEPLEIDEELTEVARVKAQDMIDNNYFAHESPTYGSPFQMMDHFGITYQTAGENLAGNQTVDSAHTSLMNSQGHRENILSSNYSEVGIGIVDGGPYGKMFVQLFKG
ncbi:CAP domain-containing protein [Shouchella sp. 1P09AA]|uniref:CAP domain-containing protein n=1 Tax=unclassified Shouchella TaxID=2893065 RepID=UPI0039A397B5